MTRQAVIVALSLACLCPGATAQQKRELKGEVVTELSGERVQYHAGVEVRLKGHGLKTDTNSDGEFRLGLPDALSPGIGVTLKVDKPNYAVYRPYRGHIVVKADLSQLVTINILPLGHPLFKSPQEIEKWADEIREKAKEQVGKEGKFEKVDLGRYIKEWALDYGFTPEEALVYVQAWIKEVEKNRDPLKRAKAEFLKENFALAGDLFAEAVTLRKARLERLKKQEKTIAAERKKLSEEIVQGLRDQGHSRYQGYRFEDALLAYEEVLSEVNRNRSPWLWAAVQNDVGTANWQLGIRLGGERGAVHLKQAVAAYRAALEVRTRDTLPQQWATTQNNLGNALSNQGIRTGGVEGAELLAQAVAAYRAALEVYTRDTLPQQWAGTQNNLGAALSDQGIRTGGVEGAELLAQAVAAYRAALEVYTRDTLPQDWAMTQNNLGNALSDQGIRTGGVEGAELLAQAVAAYRAALEVYTRDTLPQQWAMTQNNLGAALSDQGIRTGGVEGAELLAQAVAAYRAALEVRTRDTLPQQWATTQNNLGDALLAQGEFRQAAGHFANALSEFPNDRGGYEKLSFLLHEKLHEYAEAFFLREDWVKHHPEDLSAKADFVENYFTAGHFAEFEEQITSLLAEPEVGSRIKVALQAIEVANLLALDRTELVLGKFDALFATIETQPEDFLVGWSFEGTKHFISQNEKLAFYREWLLELFVGLEAEGRTGILGSLQATRESFQVLASTN